MNIEGSQYSSRGTYSSQPHSSRGTNHSHLQYGVSESGRSVRSNKGAGELDVLRPLRRMTLDRNSDKNSLVERWISVTDRQALPVSRVDQYSGHQRQREPMGGNQVDYPIESHRTYALEPEAVGYKFVDAADQWDDARHSAKLAKKKVAATVKNYGVDYYIKALKDGEGSEKLVELARQKDITLAEATNQERAKLTAKADYKYFKEKEKKLKNVSSEKSQIMAKVDQLHREYIDHTLVRYRLLPSQGGEYQKNYKTYIVEGMKFCNEGITKLTAQFNKIKKLEVHGMDFCHELTTIAHYITIIRDNLAGYKDDRVRFDREYKKSAASNKLSKMIAEISANRADRFRYQEAVVPPEYSPPEYYPPKYCQPSSAHFNDSAKLNNEYAGNASRLCPDSYRRRSEVPMAADWSDARMAPGNLTPTPIGFEGIMNRQQLMEAADWSDARMAPGNLTPTPIGFEGIMNRQQLMDRPQHQFREECVEAYDEPGITVVDTDNGQQLGGAAFQGNMQRQCSSSYSNPVRPHSRSSFSDFGQELSAPGMQRRAKPPKVSQRYTDDADRINWQSALTQPQPLQQWSNDNPAFGSQSCLRQRSSSDGSLPQVNLNDAPTFMGGEGDFGRADHHQQRRGGMVNSEILVRRNSLAVNPELVHQKTGSLRRFGSFNDGKMRKQAF